MPATSVRPGQEIRDRSGPLATLGSKRSSCRDCSIPIGHSSLVILGDWAKGVAMGVAISSLAVLSACGDGAHEARGSTTTVAPTPSTMASSTTAATSPLATTTSGVTLPGAPPCSAVPAATSPKIRPNDLVLACADANAVITNITWSSWGSFDAFGTGTFRENQCVPDCAQGTFAVYPESHVELANPTSASGVPAFEEVVVTPSSDARVYTNDTPGAWGWT